VPRAIRDTVIAVLGGLLVGLVVMFTTDLSHFGLIVVYLGGILSCGAGLGGLALPGILRRRRAAFKAEVISEVMAQIRADSTSAILRQRSDRSFGGIRLPANEAEQLHDLITDGRLLQVRIRQMTERQPYDDGLPAELANEIAIWEASIRTALMLSPELAEALEQVPMYGEFGLNDQAYETRTGAEVAVLERAIRALHKTSAN
jgi:hypothetical protein